MERLDQGLSSHLIPVSGRAGFGKTTLLSELFLALGTVRSHVHNIYGKLGAQSRTQAIARARELNLL
jgi:LuxR family maltose regulon positive regulatory protein